MTESSKNNGGKAVIKLDDAVWFLEQIWTYASSSANCYAVVAIDGGVEYEHFCLSELENYGKLLRAVRHYLSGIGAGKHVYYQVLPLSVKPAKGRGSEREVKVGKWLWVDFDYKEVVDRAEFTGCRELEDHALECYYTDSGRVIHVKRPPLSQVLSEVRDKLGLEPWFIVDSGAGYHMYFKLSYEVDSSTLKKLESWIVDKLGGDPQAKDLARILRLPGSVNPRTQRLVQVIHYGSEEVDPEALLQRVEAEREAPRVKPAKTQALRELTDTEILRIVNLLKEAYKPGYRQFLILYLSGCLAKARVSPLSAVRIVQHLRESTEDTDSPKTRLSAVVYSYKKAGINVDEYASEIESITGAKPYGLEREIQEEEVKGISGLQEILEKTVGEERALSIVHELSEILQTLSPYRDSVVELLDYGKQLYAVANLRKLIIARAKRDPETGTLSYRERIAMVAPTRVVVYSNPIGGITKYEITFEGATLQRPLVVGPALIDEIADRLCSEGLVYHRRLIHDTLSAIIQAYIRKGKAEVRTELEAPGFYYVEGKVVAVKYKVESVDVEKLRQALVLLNELAEVWFKHVQDKFSTVIKWGAIAPFSYVIKVKLRDTWLPWLYLFGNSDTGKTTLGGIVLRLWGLNPEHDKGGTNIDTVPRLGYVVSSTAFPVLINEPGGALSKEEIVEAIKHAVEKPMVRGKYVRGVYTEYPALAPLIFTSNRFLPKDEALLKRFKVVHFSYGEKIPKEKQNEFKEKVLPRLGVLSEIGKCVAKHVMENPDLLDKLDGGVLLEKCYEVAGLEKPAWLNQEYTENPSFHETIVEEFVERLKKYINDSFARYVSRIIQTDSEALRVSMVTPDQVTLAEKVRILVEKNLLAGVRPIGKNRIAITATLLREIELEGRVSLKSLAEIMGWEYKPVRIAKEVVKAVVTTVDSLIETLS
ncbi:MAG: hypothetical protein QXI85_04785 [Desulfurococcaceae archaeon]